MIPFHRPFLTGKERVYLDEVLAGDRWHGDGLFFKRCETWLEKNIGCKKALLTHSCTGALELAAILAGIEPGDEVILPSFTFVSTANAFVLRGAIPVFIDCRPDTFNIDEKLIESAITERTRAIIPVHYGGVACAMDPIMEIAKRHGLIVIEDAAQAINADYCGRPLGSIGQLAAMSFHNTKNISAGEGGAIFVNDPELIERAEIIREKGTNRKKFVRGEVGKYSWVDIGSSFLPSEFTAAVLMAQLESLAEIQRERMEVWRRYHSAFEPLEKSGIVQRPIVPAECGFNGHIYSLLLRDGDRRNQFLQDMRSLGVEASFHYVPLHDSAAGIRFSRTSGSLDVTNDVSRRLARLPLWTGMGSAVDEVIATTLAVLS